ncbi:MAG: ABC transporter substrate-binding protein [Actinomycetia bacterium]|nr:ABC transporter substrate-binding protein [Actinomycetes bacterium]
MNRIASIGIVAASALALAGCGAGGSSGSDEGPKNYRDGGTLTMAISGDPGALTPATAVDGNTNLLLSFAYDTLAYVGEDGDLVPGLAESWKVQPKSVEFTLKEDATCSDGSPVKASTVADSINHVVDPKTKSPLVGVLIPADMTVEADDAAGTVTLQTEKPSQFLLHSTVAIFIVCGEGLEDPSVLADATSGSGAYELVDSVPNDHYTLKAREDYTWGPDGTSTADPGVPEKVVLRVVPNESTAANLIQSGDVDVATFTGVERQRVEQMPDVTTELLPAGNGEFWFNQEDGLAGSDPAVRQALTTALNLDELAKVSTQGTGVETTGMTTLSPRPCRVDSVSGTEPTHDPETAAATLEEAGWKLDGDVRMKNGEPLEMRILYNSDFGTGTQAEAEYVAAAWEELGVSTEIKAAAGPAYSEALFTTGDWDWATVPVGVSLPSQLLGYASGPGVPEGSNFAHIENPSYDKAAAEAGRMSLDQGACEKWAEAESALFTEYDVVPVVEWTQMVAAKNAEVVMPGGLAQPTRFHLLED